MSEGPPSPGEPPPSSASGTPAGGRSDTALPGEPPAFASSPPPHAAPRREPFWGYTDLVLVTGLAIPCLLAGLLLVKAVLLFFRLKPTLKVLELLPEQLLGYAFLFAAMAMLFRMQYGEPFWRSLGWRDAGPPLRYVIAGLATAIGVSLVAYLIHTPTTANPLTDVLLQSRTSLVLMAIFGVTFAPLSEELMFRGFLQPLLVRSLGAIPGILMAALPFGLLHYHEYGNSWRHALAISLAGAAFGWMRHVTGSTKASTIMHAAYNALIFMAAAGQSKGSHP